MLATVGPFVTASVSSIDMFAHGVEALVVFSVAVREVEGGDPLEDFGCYLVTFARGLIQTVSGREKSAGICTSCASW